MYKALHAVRPKNLKNFFCNGFQSFLSPDMHSHSDGEEGRLQCDASADQNACARPQIETLGVQGFFVYFKLLGDSFVARCNVKLLVPVVLSGDPLTVAFLLV